MFVYNSTIGQMLIVFNNITSRYNLVINDVVYGSYHSAVAAADDVYLHVTGCYDWDVLDGTIDPPTDIYEWDRI